METQQTPTPYSPVLPSEAWDALAEARAAMKDEDLIAVNLDVQAAATIALGAYPELRAIRERAMAELVGFDPRCIDLLPLYAAAAYHGQTLFQTSQAEIRELPALYDEAFRLRETFHTDLSPLVRRGLIDASRLKEYNGGVGYSVVASDLAKLISTARMHWAVVQGKTTLTANELTEAERLAQRIVVAVGLREQGPAVTAAASVERQRALTLFVRAYDEVRRVVTYLRWREQDAERIAPTLYGPRMRGPKRRGDAAGGEAEKNTDNVAVSDIGPNPQRPSSKAEAEADDAGTELPPGLSPFTA